MPLSVLMTVVAALLLFGSGFFSLFTPLPFSILLLRRGSRAVALAIILALFLLALTYQLGGVALSFLPGMPFYPHFSLVQIQALALLSFFYYIWIGISLTWASLGRHSWIGGVGQVIGSTLVVSGVLFLMVAGLVSLDLSSQLKGSLQFLVERFIEVSPAISPEESTFLRGPLLEGFWHLLPALWVNMTLFVTTINLLLLRRWLPGLPFSRWGDYSLWRLKEVWIWAPLSVGAIYFLNVYLLRLPWVSWLCLNLILLLAALYFFQGLAILTYLLQRRLTPLMRMGVFFLLFFFFQPLALLLILVGLFDFWFDFRKVKP